MKYMTDVRYRNYHIYSHTGVTVLVLNTAYVKFLYFGLLSIDVFDILFLLCKYI